jgi:hypothetical protein
MRCNSQRRQSRAAAGVKQLQAGPQTRQLYRALSERLVPAPTEPAEARIVNRDQAVGEIREAMPVSRSVALQWTSHRQKNRKYLGTRAI